MSASAGEGFRLRQPPLSSSAARWPQGWTTPEFSARRLSPRRASTSLLTPMETTPAFLRRIFRFRQARRPVAPFPTGGTRSTCPLARLTSTKHGTTLNLIGGYLTETEIGGGRVAFAVNVPLVTANRDFNAVEPAGTVSGRPPVSCVAAPVAGRRGGGGRRREQTGAGWRGSAECQKQHRSDGCRRHGPVGHLDPPSGPDEGRRGIDAVGSLQANTTRLAGPIPASATTPCDLRQRSPTT